MTEPAGLGLLVAFAAGLLSFLSPCVLPLVPSYVGFLTGMTLPELSDRWRVAALHALLFVAGFSFIFVLLGASATALGGTLKYYQHWIARIGGVLIILFGLVCLGLFRIGWLQQDRRLEFQRKPVGYLGSALVGMAFGAGWTPCIGPVLGGGLAVPFLIAAIAVESFLDWFQRFRRFLPWVMRVSGALLIVVGLLMVSGQFTRLAGWLQSLTPAFIRNQI